MKDETDRSTNRLPVDDSREHLMVQVARMAWQQDMTATEIAQDTGLNRWQVSRLLQEARDLGIVRIEIVPRSPRNPGQEAALTRAYGLRDALVVPSPALEDVAQAAAQYLATLKPQPRTLGLSWGRTMAAVGHALPQDWADGVRVVQINGAVAPLPGGAFTGDVAELFARKGRGRMIPLPVPAIVGARLTREVLERDRIVADVLVQARAAEVLMFSLGVAGEDSILLHSGNILPDEMQALLAAGAVGDILGHFIDAQGRIVDPGIEGRTIGLTLEDLKGPARTVCIAAGPEKQAVTLAALRAGLIDVLVTDGPTATFALEHADDR
ncbi:sugar-binding transcriptional regulator [Neotabrizicola sp. VNH66]|uniref:sugar-binding transcriptional regulator n=1 Tax=Neotabrizicola sp. VNH66 TaxID=3400918 RepID=UPI003C127934